MPTIPIPKRPFLWAVALLVISAAVCGYTIYRLESSEHWIHHTYDVQLAVASIEHDLTKAGRARSAFVDTGDTANLKDFADARTSLASDLDDLQRLIADNEEQAARAESLRSIAASRIQVLQKAIELKQSGKSDLASQAALTGEVVHWAFETASVTDAMQRAEASLLDQRTSLTASFFNLTLAAIVATFCLAALLFWINDRMLVSELKTRQAAEHNAQLLSTALMRIQDEERRKFSRELHDSLGQTLAGVKMLADGISAKWPSEPALQQLSELLSGALKETRTLSQLLHPPLLDEVGFLSAARWFIEEFAQRTGVATEFKHDPQFPELPKNIELTLFRILQEALTNVHRHAQSARATVELEEKANRVTVRIRDYGVGIPEDKLSRFQSDGSGVGVGLAGMRNRVKEQGGTLSVTSDQTGTLVVAELPTDYALNASESIAATLARASKA
jgi:signal transduction histidine kinase